MVDVVIGAVIFAYSGYSVAWYSGVIILLPAEITMDVLSGTRVLTCRVADP